MKKLTEIFLALATLLATQNTYAIRSVGNGGGEAEMRAIHQFSMIGVWLRFCSFSPNNCFKNSTTSQKIVVSTHQILSDTKITNIKIVNATEYQKSYDNQSVVLIRESLYINSQIPRPDSEILNLILMQTLKIKDNNFPYINLNIEQPAIGYIHQNELSGVLKGKMHDYIVSLITDTNIHDELCKKLNITNYTVMSQTNDGYLIKSKNNIYNISIKMINDKKMAISYNLFAEP